MRKATQAEQEWLETHNTIINLLLVGFIGAMFLGAFLKDGLHGVALGILIFVMSYVLTGFLL